MRKKHIYPPSWETRLLDEITARGSGHTPNQKHPEYWNGGIKWVSLADSSKLDNRYIYETAKEISTLGLKNSSAVLHPKGTVILSRDAGVGKSGILGYEMAVSQHFIAWHCEKDKILFNEYLYYWLQWMKPEFERIATGSTIKTIGLPYFKKLRISYPSYHVQARIAGILKEWDIAIDKTEKLIKAKDVSLRHYISSLVTGNGHAHSHIRDVAIEVSERNIGAHCQRVLSVTNDRGFVLPEDQFERRVASADVANYKLVTKGQYAYNPSRINVGSIARLDDWDEGVLSPMYVVFKVNENKINSDYFLHWLSSHAAHERIKRSAQGSVRETVSFGDLGAISLPLPDLKTQEKIASALNALRREVELLTMLVDAYSKQKQGLMQKLLTGEVRVASCEVS